MQQFVDCAKRPFDEFVRDVDQIKALEEGCKISPFVLKKDEMKPLKSDSGGINGLGDAGSTAEGCLEVDLGPQEVSAMSRDVEHSPSDVDQMRKGPGRPRYPFSWRW